MTNIKGNLEKNTFAKECMFMALKKLLRTKTLDRITISELAETAGVSRTTFYRNYSSVRDILVDYLEIHPFGAESPISYSSAGFDSVEDRLRDSFEMLYKEKDLVNAILASGEDVLLFDNYDKLFKNTARDRAFEIGFRTKYELSAFVGTYFCICYDWIKGGMQESVDEMVDISYRILHKFYVKDEYAKPERDDVYQPTFKEEYFK